MKNPVFKSVMVATNSSKLVKNKTMNKYVLKQIHCQLH